VEEVVVRDIEETSEQARVVSVQLMAFSADPVMRWLFPEAHDYTQSFPRFVRAFCSPAFEQGTIHVAGNFWGAALWLAPGVHVDQPAVEKVVRESLPDSALGETVAVLQEMDRYHITEPHWYLPTIGVDPTHQGKGVGSALLRHALAQVDEQGMPGYLESSNPANVPLYQRHGFEVLGEIRAEGGPPIFPMLRPPR